MTELAYIQLRLKSADFEHVKKRTGLPRAYLMRIRDGTQIVSEKRLELLANVLDEKMIEEMKNETDLSDGRRGDLLDGSPTDSHEFDKVKS